MTKFIPTSLITTDLHLSEKDEDQYRLDLFKWIATNYADRLRAVFILGDLTDRKNFHPDILVHRIVDALHDLSQCCHVFVLRGNHDYDTDPSTPFFGFLGKLPNVTYISRPTLWIAEDAHGWPPTCWRLLFLPYTREPGKGWDLKKYTEVGAVFLHQTFRGAVSETGYRLSGIGTSRFRRFDCPIFSGDVHVPQQIGPITYVGSPYHVHYGDRFEPRVLLADDNFNTENVHFPAPRKLVFDLRAARELRHQKVARPGDMAKVRLYLPLNKLSIWPEQRDEIRRIANKMQLKLGSIILKELRSIDTKDVRRTQPQRSPKVRTQQDTFHIYCKLNKVGEELTLAGETLMEEEM